MQNNYLKKWLIFSGIMTIISFLGFYLIYKEYQARLYGNCYLNNQNREFYGRKTEKCPRINQEFIQTTIESKTGIKVEKPIKMIYINSLGDGYTDLIVELNKEQFTSILAQIKEESSWKLEAATNLNQHSFCYLDNEGFSYSSQSQNYQHYFFNQQQGKYTVQGVLCLENQRLSIKNFL